MTITEIKEKILSDRYLITKDNLIKRDFTIPLVKGMATVITGPRRAGKSSLLRLYAQNLINQGTPIENICYMSFFDDAFNADECTISMIAEAFYSMKPELMENGEVYFLLDEIQYIKEWGTGISRLLDYHNANIIITGSSARLLSTEIATELRGRSIPKRFYPLSFREFIRFQGYETDQTDTYSETDRIQLLNLQKLYLERGSYPQLATIEDKTLRKEILSTYLSLTVSADLIEHYEITKANILIRLIKRLVKTSGSPQTITKLKHFFESDGIDTSTSLISTYIDLIKETMFISPVEIYGNEKKRKANPVKYYTADHAMPSLMNEFTSSPGMRMEHAVFNALQRRYDNIFYYLTKEKYEIDFIATDDEMIPQLAVQVSFDLSDSLEREIRAIESAAEELNIKEFYLITESEYINIKTEKGTTIHIIPCWRFLLSLS